MKLIPIDLTEGDDKFHPAWNEDDYFLVEQSHKVWDYVVDPDDEYEENQIAVDTGKRKAKLWFGQFHKVWFGWHFSCGFGVSGGFQYDQPGHNASAWSRVWKLEGYEQLSDSELSAILSPRTFADPKEA